MLTENEGIRQHSQLTKANPEDWESQPPDCKKDEFLALLALPPGPVTLEADPTLLEQALTNLLVNAVKYTGAGGDIRLTVERVGEDIVFRVCDSGIGIASDVLPHVFDLFWQSSRTADHSEGGLGIGLALVRQIVALHGGSVRAVSEGLGKGSEFVVRLPRATFTEGQSSTHCANEKSI